MIRPRSIRSRAIAMSATTLVVVCAGVVAPAQSAYAANYAAISGAGSTWSYNAIHAWIANVAQFGLTVNYTPNGSTAGRQEFSQVTTNFAASEIPYGVQDVVTPTPPPSRGYAYMPDTAGGTVFMYNLHVGTQQITDLRLSGGVITKIFTNQITNWNDQAIAADNPGLTLPNEQITPVVRSDGSGATADFTAWMNATDSGDYQHYCHLSDVNRSPCAATSAYPVDTLSGHMIAQSGDTGVSGYVAQQQSEGAIGYTEFSYALQAGFPVAKVLNAAGYYTEPTPGHIAVSLLNAKINTDQSSPLYLTEDLSQVYTDTDPRTYELSAYSYMILPTDTAGGLSGDQGYTMGQFGQYLLCQGQTQVDALGYSALPINLVQAGYAQLQRIPGNTLPNVTSQFIQNCNNPTFSSDGTNKLADTDPQPPACDKQGSTMCTSSTGGAPGSGGSTGGDSGGGSGNGGGTGGTGGSGGSSGSSGSGGSSGASSSAAGSGGATPSRGATTPGAAGSHGATPGSGGTGPSGAGGGPAAGATAPGSASTSSGPGASLPSCDPTTGICAGATTGATGTSGGTADSNTAATSALGSGAQTVALTSGLGDGPQVALMALAAALFLGVGVLPPLIILTSRRRQQWRGGGRGNGRDGWR